MKMMKLTENAKELARTWGRFIRDNESILEEEMYTLEDGNWSAMHFVVFFKNTLSHSRLSDVQWEKFISAYKELHVNSNTAVPRDLLKATLEELRGRRGLSVYCNETEEQIR